MKRDQVKVGLRVRTVQEFSLVPRGTLGVIDEMYATGCMVAWDLPSNPLPAGYAKYEGLSAIQSGILRDGFDYESELQFLMPSDNVEPENAKDDNARESMRAIAGAIEEFLPQGWGFALFTFPLGDSTGRLNYAATGKREDIRNLLKEFLEKTEDPGVWQKHIP